MARGKHIYELGVVLSKIEVMSKDLTIDGTSQFREWLCAQIILNRKIMTGAQFYLFLSVDRQARLKVSGHKIFFKQSDFNSYGAQLSAFANYCGVDGLKLDGINLTINLYGTIGTFGIGVNAPSPTLKIISVNDLNVHATPLDKSLFLKNVIELVSRSQSAA